MQGDRTPVIRGKAISTTIGGLPIFSRRDYMYVLLPKVMPPKVMSTLYDVWSTHKILTEADQSVGRVLQELCGLTAMHTAGIWTTFIMISLEAEFIFDVSPRITKLWCLRGLSSLKIPVLFGKVLLCTTMIIRAKTILGYISFVLKRYEV